MHKTNPAIIWTKSSYSADQGQCVEVAKVDGQILVRDSKHAHGAMLAFTKEEWGAFARGIRNREFDDLT